MQIFDFPDKSALLDYIEIELIPGRYGSKLWARNIPQGAEK